MRSGVSVMLGVPYPGNLEYDRRLGVVKFDPADKNVDDVDAELLTAAVHSRRDPWHAIPSAKNFMEYA